VKSSPFCYIISPITNNQDSNSSAFFSDFTNQSTTVVWTKQKGSQLMLEEGIRKGLWSPQAKQ